MVPPYSHGISRAPWYSGSRPLKPAFVYGTLTLSRWPSQTIPLADSSIPSVLTPEILLPLVWPLPRSLATTGGISVDFFSSPYLDVSVQAVPHHTLWIHVWLTRYCRAGLPHSVIPGYNAYVQLPEAFRSLSRLSSAPDAKAFPLRSL